MKIFLAPFFLLGAFSVSIFAANCAGTSVGKTPVNDLGTGLYQGFAGGLFPGGVNLRPPAHDANLDRTGRVKLLNSAGQPDALNGRIVLLSIGMSNTTMEFSTLIPLANADPQKNARVTLVDGAVSGMDAVKISDPANPSYNTYWTTVDNRLLAAGVTGAQVEAVWLKEAVMSPTGAFPVDAQTLQGYLAQIVRIIKTRFPNTRIVYLSSRIYAGYASVTLNPEPYAYQSAFAVKWLIAAQLGGDPTLNFDPAKGAVTAPWLAWGPYMWADGIVPRSDGLTWVCSEFNSSDGTHPAASAQTKIANFLLNFFKTDASATPWFTDCNTSDPATFRAPPEIQNVRLVKGAGSATQLAWDSLAEVTGSGVQYDLISGDLVQLRQDGNFLRGVCVVNSLGAPAYSDGRSATPALTYYLSRGRNVCGSGTYDQPTLDGSAPLCP